MSVTTKAMILGIIFPWGRLLSTSQALIESGDTPSILATASWLSPHAFRTAFISRQTRVFRLVSLQE